MATTQQAANPKKGILDYRRLRSNRFHIVLHLVW